MAKEICISSTPHETRLAILEDDQLAEIYYERENEYTLAGSIYNGRVTRVLPGMQSAFVDVGLERDAFLYVTDFLELEDPEESDEVEKAAVSGGAQPPREIRHTSAPEQTAPTTQAAPSARNGGRGDRGPRNGQRPDSRQDQSQAQKQDRQPRDRQLTVEPIPATEEGSFELPSIPAGPEHGDEAQDDSSAAGAKRWRGRRRRRGGRGPGGSQEGHSAPEGSAQPYDAAPEESEEAPTIQAAASIPDAAPTPRGSSAPTPFVLPGESLRKYGGTSADDAPATSAPPAPVRPSSNFKPSTLIEAPLQWDGSGLLPGESISKHRGRPAEPVPEPAEESYPGFSDAPQNSETQNNDARSPDNIEEQEFYEEMTESTSSTPVPLYFEGLAPDAAVSHLVDEQPDEIAEQPYEEDEFEETAESAPETAPGTSPAEPAASQPQDDSIDSILDDQSATDPLATAVVRQDEVTSGFGADMSEGPDSSDHEPPVASAQNSSQDSTPEAPSEPDADASHHVDPHPPTQFRFFGLGKKKTEEPAPAPPAPKPAAAVSSYAPGSGHIEEEVIEEEEFDAPHHHHAKADEHDLEDYEEETLPVGMRTGDLGEMLQEAHLDHRIQLNFDGKNGEDDGDDEDEEDDAEETTAEGQPTTSEAQQRRDRDRGRSRRGGRSPQGAPGQNTRRGGPSRRSAQTSDLPIISDLLKPGQEILVQIAKEPIAKKGARITSHIALPGRFLVFMPTVSHIGVSRKIASDEERQRLKRILISERGEASGGFIVRTAAEGASEEDLRADLRFLLHLWAEIKQRSESSKSPALIYHDLSLIERILRDQVSANFSSIWVDSQEDYERIVRFLNRFSPTLVRRVKMYTKETPLFEHFGIQDEISKALRSKVWLKSGGSIVINQTEALVAIDINTGKYVGKSARLEDTIVKTNLDAVPEIVRQIRLRDLGGIIIIDFIDMDERKNRFKVMAALEEALKNDRAPTKVLQFNDFGLVAITRKRVKQSLERTLSVPCPTCQATGMVKSPTTVCNEIYTELRKMKKHFEGADVLLRVNPETVKVLKSNNAGWLNEFEELIGKNILVKSDATLHPEQFDIQG
ncbi:MAG: Rne/Rng family ribonuclease [Terracidiphilus sp.]|jgi:ribonuclease G